MNEFECKFGPFFISEKISCVRWLFQEFKANLKYITASWDQPINYVRLWRIDTTNLNSFNEHESKCIDKYEFKGDINEVEVFRSQDLIVACSTGHITVLNVNEGDEGKLSLKARSSLLHKFNSGKPASCTSISFYDKDIVTVGEDGRLNIIEGSNLNVVKSAQVDSCALTDVCFLNPQEILCSSRMGVIKVFDTRYLMDEGAAICFSNSCEDDKKPNYLSCLTHHPTQKHVVLAGSEEGSVSVWDLRYQGFPVSYLNAYTCCVTAIGFQKSEEPKLLTSSERGELWSWSRNSSVISNNLDSQFSQLELDLNPWLSGNRAKSLISVTSLISDQRKAINSFDSLGSNIICGGDGETIYVLLNT